MCPYDPGDVPLDIGPEQHGDSNLPADLIDDAVNAATNTDAATPSNGNGIPPQGGAQVIPDDHSDHCTIFSEHRFVGPGRLNIRSEVLSRPWIQEHDAVRQVLSSFARCSHSSDGDSICETCRADMEPGYLRIRYPNPVLSTFCEKLSYEEGLQASRLRAIASSTEKLVALHIKEAKGFFTQMDRNMPQDCYDYWGSFGSADTMLLESDGAAVLGSFTGFVFPGRGKFRKDLRFDKLENFDCNKQYVASKRFSPGILTVQCCCENPQLLGYVVMTRAESTGMALTTVLSNFQVPPRVVYYDNACNLSKSVMLRAPWLLHCSKFIVDRFHFKSHTCCELYDADSYFSMDLDRTTTAESFNARLEKSVPYLRFVKAENLIPHLNIRFALLNVASRYRRRYKAQDLEDCDLWEFFKDTVPCNCEGCRDDAIDAIEARDVAEYNMDVPHAVNTSSNGSQHHSSSEDGDENVHFVPSDPDPEQADEGFGPSQDVSEIPLEQLIREDADNDSDDPMLDQ